MNSMLTETGNKVIMNEETATKKDDNKGVQSPEAVGDTTVKGAVAKAETDAELLEEPDLPPDLKEAKSSPTREGADPKEVVDMFAEPAAPSKSQVGVNKETSKEDEKEVQSTPNTPLRGTASKDSTPKKEKKKRTWLSLSPGRRKLKGKEIDLDEETKKVEAAPESARAGEAENMEVVKSKADEESNVEAEEENKPEPESEAKNDIPTTPEPKREDYETVTEDVALVRETEGPNHSRADSDNEETEKIQNTLEQKTDEVVDEMDLASFSPESKPPKKEEEKSEKTPTRKNKWLKKPKINLSFKKKRNKKKDQAEEKLQGELENENEEEKQTSPQKEERNIPLDGKAENEEQNLEKSTHQGTEKERDAAEPRGSDTREFSNFGRVVAGLFFCLLGLVASFLIEQAFLDGACAPIRVGTTLDSGANEQSTFEAPWWASTSFKSKGLFDFVCGDRPRAKVEWIFEKQSKTKNFFHLVISDLDCPDPKKAILLDQKHVTSATFDLGGISIMSRVGLGLWKEQVWRAPWSVAKAKP